MVTTHHYGLKKLLFKTLLLTAMCITAQLALAQEIRNLAVQKSGDDVIIRFDLRQAANPQELYDIEIFSSHDSYASPLELKKGKVKDVFPGLSLNYILDAKKIFDGFEGEVDFKVIATLTFIPLEMIRPTETVKVKAGKSIDLEWKGGSDNSTYKIDYSKEGGNWTPLENQVYDKKYTWYVPKKAKKGTYSVKVTSDEKRAKAIYSGNIVIKKKVPVVVKLLPLLAAGAAAYFVFLADDGGGDATTTGPTTTDDTTTDDTTTGGELEGPPPPPTRSF